MRPFDASKVQIERKRFSTTQGEVAVSYGGHLINQYGDQIELRHDDKSTDIERVLSWQGLPDEHWIEAMRVRFELAARVYAYCEEHYGDKDARFDVIVECMDAGEIMAALERERIADFDAGCRWADKRAGLHHEQELNQAWDGPESVKSSSRYDPAHDPAGPEEKFVQDFGCDQLLGGEIE
jgi:hypothetical protein